MARFAQDYCQLEEGFKHCLIEVVESFHGEVELLFFLISLRLRALAFAKSISLPTVVMLRVVPCTPIFLDKPDRKTKPAILFAAGQNERGAGLSLRRLRDSRWLKSGGFGLLCGSSARKATNRHITSGRRKAFPPPSNQAV